VYLVGLHINAGKAQLVHIGVSKGEVNTIQVGGNEMESVEERVLTLVEWYQETADETIKIRLGKANATYDWLSQMFGEAKGKLKIKIRLHESVVLVGNIAAGLMIDSFTAIFQHK